MCTIAPPPRAVFRKPINSTPAAAVAKATGHVAVLLRSPKLCHLTLSVRFFRFVSGSHEVILFDASYRKVSIESIN